MYVPRGKLLALVMIVVAASLVTGTGAFSTVQTERTANVQVAGDANAYLGLKPVTEGSNNGKFAHQKNGKLVLDFNEKMKTENGGKGVNPDSITTFDKVFLIKNQGNQKVSVSVKDNNGKRISIYDSKDGSDINNERTLKPGDSIKAGVKIDASGKTKGTITEKITITAKNPDSAKTPSPPNSGSNNPKQ